MFEEHYKGQVKLCEETLLFLERIGRGYPVKAKSSTQKQYADILFVDNRGYLVKDLYAFFNGTKERQEKNQKTFEEDEVVLKGKHTTSDSVIVSIPEIIKLSGFSFTPLIRGVPTYIEWQERVIYDTNRFICVVGSRQ